MKKVETNISGYDAWSHGHSSFGAFLDGMAKKTKPKKAKKKKRKS